VMISATFSPAVESLANKIFKGKPVRLEAGTNAVPSQIEYFVIQSDPTKKDELLEQLVKNNPQASAIVFCNTRDKCAEVAGLLSETGVPAGLLHGKLEQKDRDKVMAQFRNGSLRILIATDLAARGIDITSLDMVINYELPGHESEFMHRTGRTARAGNTGKVYSLVSAREMSKLDAWIPKYTVINTKEIFEGIKTGNTKPATKMVTIHLHAGKKEKISQGDIVGALTGEAGLEAGDIGIIELFDHFSYVAVSHSKSKKVLERLNEGKIKGRKIKVSLVG
ncbi:MAG: helicase-related protein, partial [Sphingobacteriales bacterium]